LKNVYFRFVLKKGTQIGIKRGFSGAVLFDNETGCRQMNFTVWDVFGREGMHIALAMSIVT